ncbi:hypothetical protein FQN60_017273, partial [Etheostoma spectabile]
GSCSHTKTHNNPWWRVDLIESYIVTSVIVTNRDSFAERINGAEIRIGNSLEGNGVTNPLAGKISSIPAGSSFTLTFNQRVEGRYVVVVLPGSDRTLTLCEVEVLGYHSPTGVNLALTGQATQSSLHQTGIAYNAIDGNQASSWEKASCSHTGHEVNPWWRLDLIKTHKPTEIHCQNLSMELRSALEIPFTTMATTIPGVLWSQPSRQVKLLNSSVSTGLMAAMLTYSSLEDGSGWSCARWRCMALSW